MGDKAKGWVEMGTYRIRIAVNELDADRYPDGAGYALANGDVSIQQLLGAVEEEASRWR